MPLDHPTQRLLERTNLPESYSDRLRGAIKGLPLPRGVVHARMPDGSFAVFKDAGGKKRLATFLSKHMSPPGRDVTSLVKERLSITKSASIPEDAVVYSAVPDIDSVMRHGLMSSEALAKNQDLLAIARPDLEDRQAWLDKLNKQSRRLSRKGPNVFFTLPDPAKIHDKHYIKKNDLKVLEIALGKLIKDQPNTRIYGMELAPFPKEKADKFPKRKGIISHKKVKELLGSTPEELWKHYNDLEGKTYAANVPHAAILTEDGLIDPKYLRALDKSAASVYKPVKEKLTMKKSANHMVEPSPDGGNYMAVSNLKSLKRNSEDLMCHVDAFTPLPDWVESKLNVAAASIDDVADWFRNGGELNKTAAVPGKVKMYRRALQALKEQSHDFHATRASNLREILSKGKITPGSRNHNSPLGVNEVYLGKGHPSDAWFYTDTALALPHKELMKLESPANPALAEIPYLQELYKKPRITEAAPHSLVDTYPLNPYHWTQVAGDVPVLPGSIAIAPEAELAGLKEVLKKSRSRFISAEKLREAAEKIPASKFWPSRSKQGSYKTADFANEPLAQKAHDKVVKEYGLTPQDGSEYWRMKTRIYKSMGGTFTGKRAKKAEADSSAPRYPAQVVSKPVKLPNGETAYKVLDFPGNEHMWVLVPKGKGSIKGGVGTLDSVPRRSNLRIGDVIEYGMSEDRGAPVFIKKLGEAQISKKAAEAYRPRVELFIHDGKGNVLANKSDKGWQFPGGGVEDGQDLFEAAKREALEEAGYNIKNLKKLSPEASKIPWPEWYKEVARKKGRGQFEGQLTHPIVAQIGKKNEKLYGSEGDALTKLKFVPLKKLIRDGEKRVSPDHDDIVDNKGEVIPGFGVFTKDTLKHLKNLDQQLSGKKTASEYRPRVELFLHDGNGNVLSNKSKDGWQFPGGGIEEGQDIFDAAKREALEEAGYNIKNLKILSKDPTRVSWPDWYKEVARKKGRGHFDGHETHFIGAQVTKKNKKLYGSEGDALTDLEFVPLKELISYGEKRLAPGNDISQFGVFTNPTLEHLKILDSKISGNKTAGFSLMSVAKDLRKTAGVYELMLKHSEEGLKPPAAVASAARRGLELRRKASPSNKGGLTASEASKQGIGSGVQRASNLANGDSVSPSTVKRMHSFFSRHEGNSAIDPEHKGKPQNDKGYVSHLLWGGDAGKRWAASQAKKLSEKEAADSIAAYLEQFV